MICMQVMGGCGNQMFQYALGRYLSLKNKTSLEFELDYFSNKTARCFVLDKFNISGHETNKWWVKFYSFVPRGKRLLNYIFPIVQEKKCTFDSTIKDMKLNEVYLRGYWGSYKYFYEIRDILKKDFSCSVDLSFTTKKWIHLIENSNYPAVSLHVRRGDYLSEVNKKIYKELTVDYYNSAISILNNKYGKLSVFIFSNDIKWAQDNLSFDNNEVNYVTGNDEDHGFEDMLLMWKCKHHVIANSTFSWWGAYLADSCGDTVAPAEFFNFTDDFHDIRDYYPENWIKL